MSRIKPENNFIIEAKLTFRYCSEVGSGFVVSVGKEHSTTVIGFNVQSVWYPDGVGAFIV